MLERNEARLAAVAAPRTIVVTGQRTPATQVAGLTQRAAGPGRSPALARIGTRPDRLALWAVGLGLVMAFMAAATAEAAAPPAQAAAPPAPAGLAASPAPPGPLADAPLGPWALAAPR